MFKGNFIVVFEDKEPQWRILTKEQVKAFLERCGIVGFAKARHYTFGETCDEVLAVESRHDAAIVAEHYQGTWQDKVCGLAACLATNTPINPDTAPPSGGLKVEADRGPPKQPRGGDKAKAVPAFQALMQGKG